VLLYVLAFTDRAIRPKAGLRLENVELDGIFAICRRSRAAPPATERSFRRQHRDVLEIARRTRAILPVRFGALIQKTRLVEQMRSHGDVLRTALDDVRDRVQMTVRIPGAAPRPDTIAVSSGRQFLEQRRRALDPVLPANAREFVETVRPLTVRERIEPGAAGLLATIYHLLPVAEVPAYAAVARELSASNIIVSGPWPPFAFTPRLW
jgi:hypothetical protein